jgi:hypothetical protein
MGRVRTMVGHWFLFPFVSQLPDSPFTIAAWWLVCVPLFFWTGLRPMRVWMHRPRPTWLSFVLRLGVPMLLFVLVGAGIRLIGLTGATCCREAHEAGEAR